MNMNAIFHCMPALLLVAAPVAPPALSPAAPPARALPADLAGLAAHEDESLSGLRAGAPVGTIALEETERDVLRAAEAGAPELCDLRGGEFSDRDLTVIAVIALAIIAIAIIL